MITLVVLLPFEPRAAWKAGGLSFTSLEMAAAGAAIVLAGGGRARLLELLRRPPLPLAALGAYALAHFVSAVLAPEANGRAAKFALRMAVMAGMGALVAAAPAAARRKGLVALVVAACLVGSLAIAEGLGVTRLDAFLEAFREMPFNVAGLRRATAGSEYPNQAAAFLMCGLLAGAGLLSPRRGAGVISVLLSATLVGGLLFTYSRGALLATGFGLLAQVGYVRWREARWPTTPLTALLVLAGGSTLFASTEEVFRLRLGHAGADEWYGARYDPEEKALILRPGDTRRTRVRVTNPGPKTWTRREAFHLSYHWLSRERPRIEDGRRTALPGDLGPGESVVLDALVTAPPDAGRYALVWDMVHEHTAWFSTFGVPPATVPAIVGTPPAVPIDAADLVATETALPWRASRAELWRLAALMWAERPWAGFGSDSFRFLYGPRAGHAYWDVRVYANNTLLEAAATTGTFGAASLLLALSSSALLVSWPRAAAGAAESGPAVALFGLVVGLFAHGVLDYVLAFTGHYLLFAFVVGSCAAQPGDPR